MSKTFLEVEPEFSQYKTSKFVVVPCPHEVSTSYGKGTKLGPKAIIDASFYVENFDEELKREPYRSGINLMEEVTAKELKKTAAKIVKDKKVPIILGGEHSLSIEAVKGVIEQYPKLSVLQFDAHADLRDTYEGSENSHACALKRILEVCPAVQIGIRNISEEEYKFAEDIGQLDKIHFAHNTPPTEKIISQLSDQVYITFDVDVFDPSVMPSTGTPEPGGMNWYEVIEILREVATSKTIVGADFVELAPIKGLHAPDFTIAKLIYKLMGYLTI
jgi:agmatinase